MTARAVRSLGLATALITTACSGSSTPPPPSPSPTPARAADGLLPLTSRDGAAPAAEPSGAASTLPAGHPPIEAAAPASGEGAATGRVSGTIAVAPGLTVGASDILYVIAKKDGSTLAVRRVETPSFPYAFEVSEGHAMVAGIALEGPVDIVARLSRTGDAIPSPGDLEGTTPNVTVPATGVAVTIDRVLE